MADNRIMLGPDWGVGLALVIVDITMLGMLIIFVRGIRKLDP